MNRAAAIAPARQSPWAAEARATLALAWPLILTNLAQSAIYATDVILLGQLSARALAAGALGVNLYVAFMIFGMGLMTAAAPMIASERGRKPHSVRDVRRTVRQTMWAAVTLVIPFWFVLWHAESILLALGQDPALARDAEGFVRAIQWGLLPNLWFLALRNYVAALERPFWALLVVGCAVPFNALTGWTLIFGHFGLPALGLRGAGVASALTNLFAFIAIALVVTRQRRFRRYRLFGHFWRPDWERYAAVWRLGLPIAVILALEVTVFNAAVFLMGLIDVASLAAHQIAIQCASLSFMVPLGLAQAGTVRVGLFHGQRDPAGIARAGWTALGIAVAFMAAMALLFWIAPRPLISVFIDLDEPANAEVAALAVSFLAIAALFQIVDGAQAVGAGVLRGLHDTRVPMIFAAFGYWGIGIGVGALLAFRFGWRGVGIWTGLAVGLAIVAALMVWRWALRERLGLEPAPRSARVARSASGSPPLR